MSALAGANAESLRWRSAPAFGRLEENFVLFFPRACARGYSPDAPPGLEGCMEL